MRKQLFLSLPFVLGLAPAVHAASDSELVVVTATRTLQPVQVTGESVSVITARDLDLQQTVSLGDALQLTPAAIVVRNGGVGQNSTISLRGADAGQTLVLVDGVRINDPSTTDAQALLGDMMVNNLDRVEILRGPQSTLYGSSAIGGVVNMLTKLGGDAPFSARASAEGGSYDTYRLNGGVNGTYENVDYGGAVNYVASGGISAADSKLGNWETDAFYNVGSNANVRVHVLDTVSVDLRGYYTSARSSIDGYPPPNYAFSDTPEFAKNVFMGGYAGLNAVLLDGRLHNRLGFIGSHIQRRFFGIYDYGISAYVPDQNYYARSGSTRVEYQGIFDLDDNNQITFGAESERNTFNAQSLQYDVSPTLGKRRTTSGFGQWQTNLFDQLTLTAGVRYDGDSQFGGHTSLKFAGAWHVGDWGTVVHANYGDGFKAPSLYQLYSQYSNPLASDPATALKAETSHGWEAGVEQPFLDNRFTASATYFTRNTRQKIDFFTCPYIPPTPNLPGCDARPNGYYYNVGRAKAAGVEFALSGQLLEDVAASVNVTHMTAQDLTARTDLPRRPKITAGGSIFWTPMDRASLGVTVAHVGERFDLANENGVLAGTTQVNVLGSYPLNANFSVFGRVENLFADKAETTGGYGAMGRAAYVGLRAAL